MHEVHTYTCEGCGATFEGTASQAFHEGWDTPEMFQSHCTCSKCPISSTLWWRIVAEGQREVTQEEANMLMSYNELHDAHRQDVMRRGGPDATPS